MKVAIAGLFVGAALVGCGGGGGAREGSGATTPTAASSWSDPSAELTIVNLYDAFGKQDPAMTKDWGFSAIVRHRGKTYLFDSGTRSDVLAKNMAKLGVDPTTIDAAIVSHSHYDHIAGFDFVLEKKPKLKMYLPEDFFALGAPIKFPFKEAEDVRASLPVEQRYFDGQKDSHEHVVTSTTRFWKADVEWVGKSKDIAPGVALVTTQSPVTGVYFRKPDGTPAFDAPLPELSATFSTSKGEVVVVGCSHSGVEAIVKETRAYRPNAKIHLLVGGYHLVSHPRPALEKVAATLHDELGVEGVAPAHCTGQLAFSVLAQKYGPSYRFFGLGSTLTVK